MSWTNARIFARALAKSDGPVRLVIIIRWTPIAIQARRKGAQAGPTSRGRAGSRSSCQSLCRQAIGLVSDYIGLHGDYIVRLSQRLICAVNRSRDCDNIALSLHRTVIYNE